MRSLILLQIWELVNGRVLFDGTTAPDVSYMVGPYEAPKTQEIPRTLLVVELPAEWNFDRKDNLCCGRLSPFAGSRILSW
jgi:hypothetical protein